MSQRLKHRNKACQIDQEMTICKAAKHLLGVVQMEAGHHRIGHGEVSVGERTLWAFACMEKLTC